MSDETVRPAPDPAPPAEPGPPAHGAVARAPADAPLGQTLLRGWRGRCPRCGEGGLFRAYLKVREECPVCAQSFRGLRADDGPAYVTILIAGHLAVPLIYFGAEWDSPLLAVLSVSAVVLAGSLVLLPRVKGAFLGVLWRSA